jgi:predicted alpha/beta hydrolase
MIKRAVTFLVVLTAVVNVVGQPLSYPHPVEYLNVYIEGGNYRMAYMDVAAAKPNGEIVLLLHGKNFNGYYWKDVITALSKEGYRVIVPDQLGWGKSDKPVVHYSFSLLANNTKNCSIPLV